MKKTESTKISVASLVSSGNSPNTGITPYYVYSLSRVIKVLVYLLKLNIIPYSHKHEFFRMIINTK